VALAVIGLIFSLAGCSASASLPTYSVVPTFSLTDQNTAAFDSRVLAQKVWVADFMFTTCTGPCPRMSAQMAEIQAALASEPDLRLLSFSIDPDRDTPDVLRRYADRYHATPGKWFFLTGPRDTLQHLDKDVFMLGNVDGTLQHSTRFVLVDRQSRLRGFYLTSEPDAIPRLIADAKILLKDHF
jgi:protein SCO1/2